MLIIILARHEREISAVASEIPGNECAWAASTQNGLVNHLEEHNRGIRRYKLGSVPVPANVTSSGVLSSLDIRCQADRQHQRHLGELQEGK